MNQMRQYIPKDLTINNWNDIKPYFDKLENEKIESIQDLENLLLHFSDVISVYHEQNAWAYIKMTCDTENQELVKRHEVFATLISPEVDKACNRIQQNIAQSPFFEQLPAERYDQLRKSLKRDLELFCEKNVPIEAELSKLTSKYEQLAGSLTVTIDGQEITLPQAAVKLESEDRQLRKKTWLAIQERRFNVKKDHDELFDQMITLRHQVALNAGYKNFRDYQHDNLHRFDYTVDDVLNFHQAIEKHVLPLKNKIAKRIKEKLNLTDEFRPWDVAGKPKGEKPLKPFSTGKELLEKAITIFSKIKPEFGQNLITMNKSKLFDLESRKGKAPGGYNYGLEVTGMPFIFMNAAGIHRDVITLMHEGGHAMHTFLTNKEPLVEYRNCPAEMAETASMSMELLTSRYWNEFYNNNDYHRARLEHLEDIIDVFPWVAIVDGFQHWVYTNPEHSHEERDEYFDSLMQKMSSGVIDWSGLEKFRKNTWQKQLHIFSVPFYYIEYAIAQLGALQIYRNYIQNSEKAINDYIAGLRLGSTKPIGEVWKTMNIKFDFSEETLQDLVQFVDNELEILSLY